MQPLLSQVCTLSTPFERDLEDYAAAHCPGLEIWLGKLETYLHDHSLDDVRRLLTERELTAPVASFQGGLFLADTAARAEAWKHFTTRIELCRSLGIGTLVVGGDLTGPLDHAAIERLSTNLGRAALQAGEAGVRLALEFQAQAAFPNNLQTAAAVVSEIDEPSLGLCLDLFHYYLGPSKPDDLGALSSENLFHVQLSDLAGVPRELATDSDRILPGDGDFLLEPILNTLRQLGYAGTVSVEVMNPHFWQTPARQVAEISITALRKLLGQSCD